MSELQEYKCPCCGGGITFDSGLQKMKCPYCESEFDVETLKKYDASLDRNVADDFKWEDSHLEEFTDAETENMRVYFCESCGGQIVADETLGATKCPYCDNPVVMMGQFSGDLKPDFIIPFKLDKNAAMEGLNNHLKGKKLLPKVFKTQNHIDEIRGIYVPFWLFDADVDADVSFDATRTRAWSDSEYDYTETSHYLVERSGQIAFDKIPVDGSSQMPDDLMESVEPFDFSAAVDFQTAYLSGYLADRYDVTAEQSLDRANQRIKTSTEEAFSNTVVGYSTVIPRSSSISTSKGMTHYAMYPIWILNTTYRDKKYLFAMNGQTGKFVGDLPMDKGLFWRWAFGVFFGCAAAFCLFVALIL